MKILLASSEVAPLVKTGGLGDVAGALPKALARLGHEVAIVMPFYGQIDREALTPVRVLPEVIVDLPAGRRALAVWRATLPGSESANPVLVYLIEDPALFERPHLYMMDGGREYPDNPLRFAYFCMAALWALRGIGWLPDLIHCNDWQTALIPLYLAHHPILREDLEMANIPVLFSIHNLAYQGLYPEEVLDQVGLPRAAFHDRELEFYGQLNLLKGALTRSRWLSTVSRTYAREIQTPEHGCGLEGVLAGRESRLSGILNGIDTESWNPETDPALAAPYSRNKLKGKAACKAALQKRFGLAVKSGVPLMGMVSRLADQKGLDLLAEVLPGLLKGDVQFVLLGTGDPAYHEFFEKLAAEYPGKAGVELGFDDPLARRIEAGCDLFLMPSRYEPCGLNQMYSLRYGTVPVVRRTGGLADSIINATPSVLESGTATGFVFTEYGAKALDGAIRRAIRLFKSDPAAWKKLVQTGMTQDFSWQHAAGEYERLYMKIAKTSRARISPAE
jgi:starch synthase